MSCDVGEVTEILENELCYDYSYEPTVKIIAFSDAIRFLLTLLFAGNTLRLGPFSLSSHIRSEGSTAIVKKMCEVRLQLMFYTLTNTKGPINFATREIAKNLRTQQNCK